MHRQTETTNKVGIQGWEHEERVRRKRAAADDVELPCIAIPHKKLLVFALDTVHERAARHLKNRETFGVEPGQLLDLACGQYAHFRISLRNYGPRVFLATEQTKFPL